MSKEAIISNHTKVVIRDMLIGIAKFDGNITAEEARLIETVAADIHKYFELVANVTGKEEGPTSLDRAELFKARLDIIKKAVITIKADLKVTTDEMELFNAIQQILPDLPTGK